MHCMKKNSKRTTIKRSQVIDGNVSKWSSPVYQACEEATGNLGELKNYTDNFLGKAKIGYMPLLSGAGEIPFHSTLTSCWVIKCSVPPGHISASPLLVITTLRAWGQCQSHWPCSAADSPGSSNPPGSPPPPKSLFLRSNSYSFGDNIALRQLLADANVPTSGQCYQNPRGPDRPGATGSRNVKIEGVFFSPTTDERSREQGERGERTRPQKNKIKNR